MNWTDEDLEVWITTILTDLWHAVEEINGRKSNG
jgi:hypothetical protein